MNKILITGGAGFIGLNLKRALSKFGFEIFTVGRNEDEDFVFDLRDSKLKSKIKAILPEVVIHLASGTNIARADQDKEKEFNDTVEGTKSVIGMLLDLKPKPRKVIYLSSQAVYGLPKCLPVSESTKPFPNTVYGECKLKAENLIIQSNLDYLIFRVSSVYGPLQDYRKSGVISKFIDKMKNNRSPVVFNNKDVFLDLIYIDDLVSAMVKSAQDSNERKNEIYNLGSGKTTTIKQILNILYRYFPCAPEPKIMKSKIYPDKGQKGLYLDIKKIQSHFKWSPKYTIEEGLRLMLEKQDMDIPWHASTRV